MTIHDPHHVAQLAATLLSSHGYPEKHHIKKAVEAARNILDEAVLRAEEDEAKAAKAEHAEKPVEAEPEARTAKQVLICRIPETNAISRRRGNDAQAAHDRRVSGLSQGRHAA